MSSTNSYWQGKVFIQTKPKFFKEEFYMENISISDNISSHSLITDSLLISNNNKEENITMSNTLIESKSLNNNNKENKGMDLIKRLKLAIQANKEAKYEREKALNAYEIAKDNLVSREKEAEAYIAKLEAETEILLEEARQFQEDTKEININLGKINEYLISPELVELNDTNSNTIIKSNSEVRKYLEESEANSQSKEERLEKLLQSVKSVELKDNGETQVLQVEIEEDDEINKYETIFNSNINFPKDGESFSPEAFHYLLFELDGRDPIDEVAITILAAYKDRLDQEQTDILKGLVISNNSDLEYTMERYLEELNPNKDECDFDWELEEVTSEDGMEIIEKEVADLYEKNTLGDCSKPKEDTDSEYITLSYEYVDKYQRDQILECRFPKSIGFPGSIGRSKSCFSSKSFKRLLDFLDTLDDKCEIDPFSCVTEHKAYCKAFVYEYQSQLSNTQLKRLGFGGDGLF